MNKLFELFWVVIGICVVWGVAGLVMYFLASWVMMEDTFLSTLGRLLWLGLTLFSGWLLAYFIAKIIED